MSMSLQKHRQRLVPLISFAAVLLLGAALCPGGDSSPGNHGKTNSHSLPSGQDRSEEHTSELQSPDHLVCRLLLDKKKKKDNRLISPSARDPTEQTTAK